MMEDGEVARFVAVLKALPNSGAFESRLPTLERLPAR